MPGTTLKPLVLLILLAFAFNVSPAQDPPDSTAGRFHDDLLDHLAGIWNITSVAHGFSSTAVAEGSWVLNHQHFYFHFVGKEIIPWIHVPMEFMYYIGYKHSNKRYVVHGVSVFGNDDYEGFCYAYRNGNEIRLLQKDNPDTDTIIVQTFSWQPASNSWRIYSRQEVNGKEGEIFLDMNLVAVKSPVKKP